MVKKSGKASKYLIMMKFKEYYDLREVVATQPGQMPGGEAAAGAQSAALLKQLQTAITQAEALPAGAPQRKAAMDTVEKTQKQYDDMQLATSKTTVQKAQAKTAGVTLPTMPTPGAVPTV